MKTKLITKADYLAAIEECYATTPWAIAPIKGIFECRLGLGMPLQEAFIYANDSFIGAMKSKEETTC